MKFAGMVSIGLVSGFFAGLFGVGGGVIIVPALHKLYQFDVKMAVGTSLAAIVPAAIVGSVTHFKAHHVDLKTALCIACGSIFATYAGSKLATVLPSVELKKAFALFLLAVAIKLLLEKA